MGLIGLSLELCGIFTSAIFGIDSLCWDDLVSRVDWSDELLNSTCPWIIEQVDDFTIDGESSMVGVRPSNLATSWFDEENELHEEIWITVVHVNAWDFCGEVFKNFVIFCIYEIEDSLPIDKCKMAHVW